MIKKKLIFILFLLVLMSQLISALKEPYAVSFPNMTECKKELKMVSRDDLVKIEMPPAQPGNDECENIFIDLTVDRRSCGGRDGETLKEERERDHYICWTSFEQLYQNNCNHYSNPPNLIIDPYGKKWIIEFGYDVIGAAYLKKEELTVLSSEQIEEECLAYEKEKKERINNYIQGIGILIALIGAVLDISKKTRTLGIIFNILGLIMALFPYLFKWSF